MRIDKRAVKLFFKRDEWVVSCVYNAYSRLLFTLSNELLHNREEAEEVVQEAYLKTLDVDPKTIKKPEALISYLCATAKNLSLNRLRALNRQSDPGEGKEGEQLATPSYDPYEEGSLTKALRGLLSEEEYKVLLLRLYLELDFKEIASALSITPSSARGYYHRALKKAKEHLHKEDWL